MADKFQVGDRVFAKMKGWPPWPASVRERIPGKAETYSVYFYGTYESAKIKPDCMFLYNEESKAKYGKLQRKARFKEAMIEMEDNIAIDDVPEPEHPEVEPGEIDEPEMVEEAPGSNQSLPAPEPSDSEEGELLIDEGPPVLKKETKGSRKDSVKSPGPKRKSKAKLSAVLTPKAAEPQEEEGIAPPTTPPVKQARRTSKAKRDSITLSDSKVETPVVPQPEIVSRSGRKIKPKRFADDEIQFGTKSSTSSPNINDDSKPEGPPLAKRAKRVSSAGSKAAAANSPKVDPTPLPPPPRLEKATPISKRTSVEKKDEGSGSDTPTAGKATPLRPPPPLRKFDAKPSLIPAPPPTLKPAPGKPPSLSRLPAFIEEKPVLEPESSSSSSSPLPEASASEVEEEDGELGPESPPVEEEELSTPMSTPMSPAEEGEVDLELSDVESDEELSPDPDSPATLSPVENGVEGSPSRKRELSNYTSEPVQENLAKRLKVELKNGASVVLSFNHDRPHLTGKSNIEWDIATAKNLLKAKSELENNSIPFIRHIVDSMGEKDEKLKHFKQTRIAERVHKKIEQLRMEGELIEIIGEIVGCLNVNSADCDRALDLLERLANQGLNTLALKKHPEVVDTVRKLQNYYGNAVNWKFTEAQTIEFNKKTLVIRDKAGSIYEDLKTLFCSTPNKPFHEVFHEEVEKFKDLVADLPENKVLGIWTEPIRKITKEEVKAEVNENHETEEELEDVDTSSPEMDTEELSPISA